MEIYSNCPGGEENDFSIHREEQVQQNHRTDSLILLGYSILLIMSVITVWIFKHKRLRFVHETGFSLIYGLILGIIFYYLPSKNINNQITVDSPPNNNRNCVNTMPPDNLILKMNMQHLETKVNTTYLIAYNYQQMVKTNKTNWENINTKATFNAEIFFNLLLPPIIFCAGYNMKKKHFFENLGSIITYAFLGTILSALVIGGICYGFSKLITDFTKEISFQDCLLFGSFISATDPVTVLAIFSDLSVEVDLYALVFGESVLNDAVAIVLAESVEKYGLTNNGGHALLMSIKLFVSVFLGALSIGCLVGVLTALLTKYTYIRDHPLLETALFCLMSYCSFLGAEAAGFSGIVASLFCGITQAHYTYNNLSEHSQRWTKEMMELLSFLAENFVFVYIGLSMLTMRQQRWEWTFIVGSLVAVVVGRAVNIYLLTAILNLGRRQRISWRYQHMLMFAGLRGAMAFALSIRNTSTDVRQMFFCTTLVIVMVTVFLCGGFTKPMVTWLKIRMGKDADLEPQTPEPINDSTVMPNQLLDATERHKKKALLIRIFSQLDCKFIKPLLTHSPPMLTEVCPQCCTPLMRLCTTSEQMDRSTRLLQHHQQLDQPGMGTGQSGDSAVFRSDGLSLPIAVQSKHRDSDLELILAEDLDNLGYIEADESGLYIQNDSDAAQTKVAGNEK